MPRFTRLSLIKLVLAIVLGAFLLLIVCFGRAVIHTARAWWSDRDELAPLADGKIDDASRLNETNVAKIWEIPADRAAAESQLASLLQYARANHLKVSIAGARHSLGGHVICPHGIVIDMLPFNHMELDGTNLLLHVQAGARWSDVVTFLNEHGLSVEVMQSNDDFTVGGSVSVNCHGWQFNRPPIASTVESFRLMRADGTIVKCSRKENPELFSLVLGGYGLFGIILDCDLRIQANERYRVERIHVPVEDYIPTLKKKTAAPDVQMVYGRLCAAKAHFLNDGILTIYHRQPAAGSRLEIGKLHGMSWVALRRAIFRGGVGDEYGKELRWTVETDYSSWLEGNEIDRNDILHEGATWFMDHSRTQTDILMECFVPIDQFDSLLADLREIIPQNGGDLLNVTVRDVNRDTDTFLNYASTDMISLVMLFSQTRDDAGERKMSRLAQAIIAATLKRDGKYYLPYRLHGTPEQFRAAYPQAQKFFTLKRQYDPDELFENEFYLKYGRVN